MTLTNQATDATSRQNEASIPTASTWLSANAGSGKTRVLIARVARLLLGGVDPQNVLCLTYTKAAASEMQNRLFRSLAAWSMLDDAALSAALRDIGEDGPFAPETLRLARTLFAKAIETPGGLRLQTIHSFCSGLLRRFPLEAGVSPQFTEMEDRAAERLRAEVLEGMATGPDLPLLDALARYLTGEDRLLKLTQDIARRSDAFRTMPDPANLSQLLGLAPDATRQDALDIAFAGHEADIVAAAQAVRGDVSASYKTFIDALLGLDLKSPDNETLETVFSLFLYADRKSSKSANYPQSNHKNAVVSFAPFIDDLHDWMDRTMTAHDQLLAIAARDRLAALYAFGHAFVRLYDARKLGSGLVDFDDLINKARQLLTTPGLAQWVLFRLDGGIDHILVDEAQDTSPAQWEVIRALASEFSAGEGAMPDRRRTIFVVGDKKQSIYSFQGADPAGFDQMRQHFDSELNRIGQQVNALQLAHSFRSSPAILRVVDAAFAGDRAAGLDDTPIQHIAFKDAMPGRVDLWPVLENETVAKDDPDWRTPIDRPSPTRANVRLARHIAAEIGRMIATETIPVEIGKTGVFARRPVRAGDVLILVQRRSDLFAEIIRSCKAANLPIAGADRLKLGGELAVRDIAALLNFLALPEDDLSLATALRSPLFGWTEQDLFTLAHTRPKGRVLWQALRQATNHPETLAILRDLRTQADFLRPYDLIERILIRHDGRRTLLARLGAEAQDGIDSLLSQAQSYERAAVPSLTGFLSWLMTEEVEVKRQLDSASNQIRVMTVHGAKGLEAPIVFLPECQSRQLEVRDELLVTAGGVLWKSNAPVRPPAEADVIAAKMEKQTEESRRLLYVAMTRAEKWLIVGAAGDVDDGDKSWYGVVSGALDTLGSAMIDTEIGPARRFAMLDWDDLPLALPESPEPPLPAMPDLGPVPAPDTATKALSPSDLGGDKVLPGEPGLDATDTALMRGRVLHLLLEHLPPVAPENRAAHARLLLKADPDAQLLGDTDALIAQALGVLSEPALSAIFTGVALAEVDITATLPDLNGRRIHGAIDRLLIGPDTITAIDFKSNRVVPDTAHDIPEGLLRQMGAYAAALAQIYPNHRIETAILWTTQATLMPIPPDLASAALLRAAQA